MTSKLFRRDSDDDIVELGRCWARRCADSIIVLQGSDGQLEAKIADLNDVHVTQTPASGLEAEGQGGTARYQAPESSNFTTAVDMYPVGIIAAELALAYLDGHGDRPLSLSAFTTTAFNGVSTYKVAELVGAACARAATLCPGLHDVVAGCVRQDPGARSKANEVLETVERALALDGTAFVARAR